MNSNWSRLFFTVVACALFFGVACAKVGFNSTKATSDNGDGSVSTTITPGGNPPGPVGPTSSSLPKIQFISPPCQPRSNCQVEFRLDKAYAQATDFDWHTNDTLYQTPHNPIYGQPGVHYVSTSGHTTFQPGETSKIVYVQNINPDSYEIIIGILISACTYGSTATGCSNFFM